MARTRNLGNLTDLLTANTTTGIVSAVTAPAQFDNSSQLVTTAWAKQMGMQAGSVIQQNTATFSIPATAWGATLSNGYTGGTAVWTLPSYTTGVAGARMEIVNMTSQPLTINVTDGQFIRGPGSVFTTMNLGTGDTAVIEYNGATTFWVLGGSATLPGAASFGSNLTATGYQKLPSGLIIQWMAGGAMAPAGTLSTNWPIAFPNAVLTAAATPVGTSQGTTEIVGLTSTNITIGEGSGTTGKGISATRIIGIGY